MIGIGSKWKNSIKTGTSKQVTNMKLANNRIKCAESHELSGSIIVKKSFDRIVSASHGILYTYSWKLFANTASF
jgi:hypothetical protein